MSRKITNPYVKIEGYNCFGCAPHNPYGLQMEFEEDGDQVISYWVPRNGFQGYGNILHGGIQATLLDELAGWAVPILLKTSGMTSRMEISYKKMVTMDKGTLKLTCCLKEMKRKIAVLYACLYDGAGQLCTEADISYYTFDPEKAKDKLYYPGYEAYFEPEDQNI